MRMNSVDHIYNIYIDRSSLISRDSNPTSRQVPSIFTETGISQVCDVWSARAGERFQGSQEKRNSAGGENPTEFRCGNIYVQEIVQGEKSFSPVYLQGMKTASGSVTKTKESM